MSDTERVGIEDVLESGVESSEDSVKDSVEGGHEGVVEEKPSGEVSSEEDVSFDEEAHKRLVEEARNRVRGFESRVSGREGSEDGSVDSVGYDLPKTEQEAAEWMKSVTQVVKRADAFMTNQAKQQEQERLAQEYRQGLKEFLDISVQSIKKKYPDFDDAAQYMYNTRANQLRVFEDMNPEYGTQGGVDKVLTQELEWILTKCIQDGKDPGETIYSFAKKLGYKGPGKTTKDLTRMRSKQESHKTLASSSGERAGTMMSLEEINALDEDEFRAWYSIEANKKRLDKIVESLPFQYTI